MAAAVISACLGAGLFLLMPPATGDGRAGNGAPLDEAALEIDLSAGWR